MAVSMSESTICRLCIDVCHKYKNLYDRNGRGNQLYEMTYKYFHPTILNMDQAKHLTAICLPCWRHIRDFHNFKLSILVAQTQLNEHAEEEVVVKLEKEDLSDAGSSIHMAINNTVADSAMPFSLSQVETETEDMAQDSQTFKEFEITVITGNVNETSALKEDKDFIALDELELVDVHEDNTERLDQDPIPKCGVSDVQNPSSFASPVGEEPTVEFLVVVDSEDDTKEITTESAEDSEDVNKLDLIEPMPSDNTIEIPSKGSGKKCGRPRKKQIAINSIRPKKTQIDQNAEQLDDLIAITLPTINCRSPCSKPFSKFSLLRQHVLQEHPNRKFTISCCRRRLTTMARIEDHFRLHVDPNAFRCETCLKDLKSNWALKRHFARTDHANLLLPENACKLCDKGFLTNSGLHQHCHSIHGGFYRGKVMVPADAPARYNCNKCDYVACTLRSYRRHRLYCHRVAGEFKCLTCKRKFNFLKNLRSHAVTHKRMVIYNCTFCPRMFTHYGVFTLHRQQAHGYEEEDEDVVEESVDGNQAF